VDTNANIAAMGYIPILLVAFPEISLVLPRMMG